MPSLSLWIPLLVAVLAVAAYVLGLADWPPFVATSGPNYYAIVAVTDDKDIGGNIMRLLEGTAQAIRQQQQQQSAESNLLQRAAVKYGAPENADLVSLGLFLDNPAVAKPRWAAGYLIDVDSWEGAQAVAANLPSLSSLPEPVRAVRIVQSSVLQARIPWRTALTPMIAPHLHWKRAVHAYRTGGGHSAECGRHTATFDASMPCTYGIEVYVTGPQGSRAWIDYILVTGDTTLTLDDLYPESISDGTRTSQTTERHAAAVEEHPEEEEEAAADTGEEPVQHHEAPPDEALAHGEESATSEPEQEHATSGTADADQHHNDHDAHEAHHDHEEELDEDHHYEDDEEFEEDEHFEHSPDHDEEHEDGGWGDEPDHFEEEEDEEEG